jgi:corrinoid protein of di/trimethylamine methyltransferase
MTETELNQKMAKALIDADTEMVHHFVEKALDRDMAAKEIMDGGLVPGMDIVGERMKSGKMFIPEVLRSAKVMQGAMELLKPHLSEQDCNGLGTVLIGTVEGDMHDIGKNLISMMLQGAGFSVVDLGTDVKTEAFVEAAITHKPEIVGMSALLTTTMPRMAETVEAFKEAGIRDQLKIMVGGAPVTQSFVDEIGADAYGANAGAATEVAKSLVV